MKAIMLVVYAIRLFGGKLKPDIFWAEFSCSCGRHCDMCEISNRAGPGSVPLACAIFTDENCNHGQKVAFLVWACNLGPPVEQMYGLL